ncbi:hypothetical protein [Chelativorans salis]|uniref:Periplasmic heavy metal sensor n=1 Tax=Chelativorans salis TaxID=2978478 RepID=A0ABT2LM85_9HYPH|nr:hypothetical protein [Chelativorans sp. EGI FJ00035]MCT7374493.1 hypothetical protein [Chelativorans sp. EGI FJ00035]
MKKLLFVLSAALLPISASIASNGEQPYAGLETRQIKALSPERIDGLLKGQGLSYALSAELNGLPGPRHVLDMAEKIALDAEQKAEIEAIFARMNAAARDLGQELVEAEAELEAAFASGNASAEDVAELTARIGDIEGRLRAVHLTAHLETDPLLSRHQKRLYAVERGYAGDAAHDGGHGGHDR